MIAEEFLSRGAEVHYVYGNNAKRPFRRQMQINPYKDFEEELSRVKNAYERFHEASNRLHEYSAATFEKYFDTVKRLVSWERPDVFVSVAAVQDYATKKEQGKMSSDQKKLVVEAYQTPKVLSLVKSWHPGIFQVGFKFLSRVDMHQLIETAYYRLNKDNSDLVVANRSLDGGFANRDIVLVTPEREVLPVSVKDLHVKLADYVYSHRRAK
jgi:phosphopantothenoylcysteine synthetase/decarboxylase